LTSIEIPNSVTNIGSSALNGCSGLKELTIPFVGSRRGNSGSSEALFGYIFGRSPYAGANQVYQYYTSNNALDYYIPTNLSSVVVTDETVLGYGAFYNCSWLKEIVLPESITKIGACAFYGCDSLLGFEMPSGVESIEESTFAGCDLLNTITLPNSMTRIASYAFSNCADLVEIFVDADNPVYYSEGNCLIERESKTLIA
jgi:hypothetical protein